MRKFLISLLATLVVGLSAGALGTSQEWDPRPEKQQIKERQKEERQALKLKHQYMRQSIQGQPLPKAERARLKHQRQREKRELRERQKDELQDLRDRRRLAKETEQLYTQ